VRWTGSKTKRPNLHIIRTGRTGKLWRRIESYHAYMPTSKGYTGEPAWKPIGDRLQRQRYLSRVDHERKISSGRQRTVEVNILL